MAPQNWSSKTSFLTNLDFSNENYLFFYWRKLNVLKCGEFSLANFKVLGTFGEGTEFKENPLFLVRHTYFSTRSYDAFTLFKEVKVVSET